MKRTVTKMTHSVIKVSLDLDTISKIDHTSYIELDDWVRENADIPHEAVLVSHIYNATFMEYEFVYQTPSQELHAL